MAGQALLLIRSPLLTADGKHLLYDENDEQQYEIISTRYVTEGDEIVLMTERGIDDQRLVEHPAEHDDPADNVFLFLDPCPCNPPEMPS